MTQDSIFRTNTENICITAFYYIAQIAFKSKFAQNNEIPSQIVIKDPKLFLDENSFVNTHKESLTKVSSENESVFVIIILGSP